MVSRIGSSLNAGLALASLYDYSTYTGIEERLLVDRLPPPFPSMMYLYRSNAPPSYADCLETTTSTTTTTTSSSSSSIHSTTPGGSRSVQQFYSTHVSPLPSPSNQQFSSTLGLLLPGTSTLIFISLSISKSLFRLPCICPEFPR